MKKILSWLVGIGGYLSLASPALAEGWGGCVVGGAATIRCLEPLFSNAIRGVVSLAVVALFIMLLIGGFKFILSGGDAKQTEQAKSTLTSAILGMALIAFSYLILKLIGTFTGVQDVTKFQINF
ncbi:hypothetical protein HY086_00650 [Candidatus Gottesmanbacteria bacterium]|nr:hypothetical protein [Candidatus Gottesmanbacteria bacterium]